MAKKFTRQCCPVDERLRLSKDWSDLTALLEIKNEVLNWIVEKPIDYVRTKCKGKYYRNGWRSDLFYCTPTIPYSLAILGHTNYHLEWKLNIRDVNLKYRFKL
jgi:hypothetical protein